MKYCLFISKQNASWRRGCISFVLVLATVEKMSVLPHKRNDHEGKYMLEEDGGLLSLCVNLPYLSCG